MKKINLLIILTVLIFILTSEIIIKKDSKVIKGKIIKMNEDTMIILSGNSEIVVDKDDIKKIYYSNKEYQDDLNLQNKIFESKKKFKNEMILVKGGTFLIGIKGDKKKPQHKVTVSDFLISKYEVTIGEFKEFIYKTTYITTPETDGFAAVYIDGTKISKNKSKEKIYWGYVGFKQVDIEPVVCVGWYDTIEYCNWLSKKEGLFPCYKINKKKTDRNNLNPNDKFRWIVECDFEANGYRLPTEAEWVFAYRGGNLSKGFQFSGADDPYTVGWFVKNSNYRTHEVGQKKPNELGIYDMSGNVSEWVWDWAGKYPNSEHIVDPKGPIRGKFKIVMGLRWNNSVGDKNPQGLYSTDEGIYKARSYVGFRIARSAK